MRKETKTQKREVIGKGRYLRLVRKGRWEFVQRCHCKGVVIIIALTDDKKVIFTEQFRLPVAKRVIEYPAGLIADGRHNARETVLSAARRELLEETGYRAQKISKLVSGPSSSGASSVILSFVQAKHIRKVAQGGGDCEEQITVHEVPLVRVLAWLKLKERQGCLVDPKIYAGLYFINKYNN